MTTPLPTDEELRKMEGRAIAAVKMRGSVGEVDALAASGPDVPGLLAYVRHLRGEVEFRKQEVFDLTESCKEWRRREANAQAEVSALRGEAAKANAPKWDRWVGPCAHGRDPWTRCETCEAAGERQALAWALEQSLAEVSDLRKQLEAATPKTYLLTQEGIRQWAADELSGYPERPSKATPPEAETHMRQALRSAAEEEARLSDPKRHPFNARLSRSEDCGDCGRRQGEHLS